MIDHIRPAERRPTRVQPQVRILDHAVPQRQRLVPRRRHHPDPVPIPRRRRLRRRREPDRLRLRPFRRKAPLHDQLAPRRVVPAPLVVVQRRELHRRPRIDRQ